MRERQTDRDRDKETEREEKKKKRKDISWLRICFGRLPLTIPSFDFVVVIVVYLSNG